MRRAIGIIIIIIIIIVIAIVLVIVIVIVMVIIIIVIAIVIVRTIRRTNGAGRVRSEVIKASWLLRLAYELSHKL